MARMPRIILVLPNGSLLFNKVVFFMLLYNSLQKYKFIINVQVNFELRF